MAGKARLCRVRAGRRAGGRLGLPGALSLLGLVLVVRTGLVGPHVGRTLSLVDTRADGGGAGEDGGETAGGELVGGRGAAAGAAGVAPPEPRPAKATAGPEAPGGWGRGRGRGYAGRGGGGGQRRVGGGAG